MFKVPEHDAIYRELCTDASPLHQAFWHRFLNLLETPRPSYHHDDIIAHLTAIAAEHHWACEVDAVKNVLIHVPATAGCEAAPVVCLQGHTDIVYVLREGHEHSKLTDPVVGYIDGEWLKAKCTTLGGDNGVAIAMALALAETDGVEHGPLELLFTSDEEVGLLGASGLAANTLKAKYLINLDSEDESELTIGCAGGMNVRMFFDVTREVPAWKDEAVKLNVAISGLQGGHTGVEIHDGRLSGIIAFGRIARAGLDTGARARLGAVQGGFAHNAICSAVTAGFAVHKDDVAKFRAAMETEAARVFNEFRFTDPGAKLVIEEAPVCASCTECKCTGPLTEADTRRIVNYALIAPFGPIQFSKTVPGLVETSFSTTKIVTDGNEIEFLGSARSSVESANDAVYHRMQALAEVFGARVSEQINRYPAWEPIADSELVREAVATYKTVTGKDIKVLAIHAGLECGVLNAAHQGMQSISIGPDLFDVHTPNERLRIASANRSLDYVAKLIADLAKK